MTLSSLGNRPPRLPQRSSRNLSAFVDDIQAIIYILDQILSRPPHVVLYGLRIMFWSFGFGFELVGWVVIHLHILLFILSCGCAWLTLAAHVVPSSTVCFLSSFVSPFAAVDVRQCGIVFHFHLFDAVTCHLLDIPFVKFFTLRTQ
jgi:hypothetical protein